MKIAIMGAGSLGTILGAFIAKEGYDITLIDSYKDHVDALNKNGAQVVGKVELNQPVKALTIDEIEGSFDLVFYMTKAPSNSVALPQLLPHLHEESIVVTLQNGIPEETVASYVGRERTVGGTVGWGATFQEPGISRLTSDYEVVKNHAFEIGEMDNKVTDRLQEIKVILECMGHTDILENWTGARWAKLFLNCVYSGLSAALGCTYGDIQDDETAFKVSTYVANEVIKAARLNGVYIIDEFQGIDPKEVEFNSAEERIRSAELCNIIVKPQRSLTASMLNDLNRGIWKTEINEICGAVSEAGKKVGLATPFTDKIVELVTRAEDTKTLPTFDNIKEFEELLNNVEY